MMMFAVSEYPFITSLCPNSSPRCNLHYRKSRAIGRPHGTWMAYRSQERMSTTGRAHDHHAVVHYHLVNSKIHACRAGNARR
jgi:hypothetical protein